MERQEDKKRKEGEGGGVREGDFGSVWATAACGLFWMLNLSRGLGTLLQDSGL